MKLSVSTLGCTEKNISEIASLCAECGIHGIEIRGIDGVLPVDRIACLSAENACETEKILNNSNVNIVGFGTSCAFHDPSKTEGALLDGMSAVRACAGFYRQLNRDVPSGTFIRVFGNSVFSDGYDNTVTRIIDGIGRLCGCSEKYGVNVYLEVHGDFNRIETLSVPLKALSEYHNFGVIWDIMHSDKIYGDDIDRFYDFIFPYTRHVHLKDCLRNTVPPTLALPGEGNIPIQRIVNRLLNDGYDGYCSFEWERKWHRELVSADIAFPYYAEYMKRNFPEWF